jgi:hypothetical protein
MPDTGTFKCAFEISNQIDPFKANLILMQAKDQTKVL